MTLSKNLRGAGAFALMSTLAFAGLTAPAHAVDGPQVNDDRVVQKHRGPVTFNVLANDSWDPTLTAEVTNMTWGTGYTGVGRPLPLSQSWYSHSGVQGVPGGGPDEIAPDVEWQPDGTVTVDFGAFNPDPWPSAVRSLRLNYELTDSLGQTSTGVAHAYETNPDTTATAAADDVVGATGGSMPLFDVDQTEFGVIDGFHPVANDTFSDLGDMRLEVVDVTGDLEAVARNSDGGPDAHLDISDIVFRVAPGAFSDADFDEVSGFAAPRTATVRYRLTNTATGDMSEATITITYEAYRQVAMNPDPLFDTSTDYMFWVGGPDEQVVDLRAVARAHIEANRARYEGDDRYSPGYVDRALAAIDGGTVADRKSLGEFIDPTIAISRGDGGREFMWFDADGVSVGITSINWHDADEVEWEPVDDEAWVAVGDVVRVPILLNDKWNPNYSPLHSGNWVGDPSVGQMRNWLSFLDRPALGVSSLDLWTMPGELEPRIEYWAGGTPGDEVLRYERCTYPSSPNPEFYCPTAKLTLHVSPLSAAQDDEEAVDPGEDAVVDVLANDVFTDTPFMEASVEVVPGSAPADVDVVVEGDRTVTLSAPASYEGETVTFAYRLTDFTGTSTAEVAVEVGVQADPDPDPAAPIARDDAGNAVHGKATVIDVHANDTFDPASDITTGAVEASVPEGVKVTLGDGGKARIVASKKWAGKTLAFRYRVTDRVTGKTDTAKVEVSVKALPPAAPIARDDEAGAVHSVPVKVNVHANDTFDPRSDIKTNVVEVSVPEGVKVTLGDNGIAKVTTSKKWAGKTLAFRYRVTDQVTGKTDTARVSVKVKPVLVIVTGADRGAPVQSDSAGLDAAGSKISDVGLVVLPVSLLLLAFLLMAGWGWREEEA